jgi:hypothetical protein
VGITCVCVCKLIVSTIFHIVLYMEIRKKNRFVPTKKKANSLMVTRCNIASHEKNTRNLLKIFEQFFFFFFFLTFCVQSTHCTWIYYFLFFDEWGKISRKKIPCYYSHMETLFFFPQDYVPFNKKNKIREKKLFSVSFK